jgi:hypothetical protein
MKTYTEDQLDVLMSELYYKHVVVSLGDGRYRICDRDQFFNHLNLIDVGVDDEQCRAVQATD